MATRSSSTPTCTCRQVLDFIAALESSEQLVDLSSVRIERGARPGAAGGSTVTVAVTVAGYARSAR